MKRMFAKYKSIRVHMNNESNHVASTKTNLEYLCDIEVVTKLMCIMLMLEVVHALITFAQPCGMFVCDFFYVVEKLCCA
jgi:hypothetical protein